MSAPDALSAFSSEGVVVRNTKANPSVEIGTVTLAELVSNEVPLKWYEAVAIVKETCDVAGSSESGVHIPELAGIEITERGSVRVQPGNPQGDVVDRAVHTLSALLTDPDLPVKLRLLIEVTSSSHQYSSLTEFSKDLQPFERPRRAHQIGVAYQRWRTAMNRPASTQPVAQPQGPPAESAVSETPRDVATARTRNRLRAIVMGSAAAVVVAAVGGVALWRSGPQPGIPGLTRPSVLERVQETTNIGLTWAADRLGLGNRGLDLSAESPSEPMSPSLARRGGSGGTAERRSGTIRVDVALPSETELPDPTPRGDAVASVNPDAPIAPTGIVYTSADPDVKPPVAIRPQMPATNHLDPSRPDVASMDILVSSSGAVEQVRLGTGPDRMSHAMLLSAAKTWQFEPAMRDGQPVPFRMKQLWLVTR